MQELYPLTKKKNMLILRAGFERSNRKFKLGLKATGMDKSSILGMQQNEVLQIYRDLWSGDSDYYCILQRESSK
jgi:hypothetical protein